MQPGNKHVPISSQEAPSETENRKRVEADGLRNLLHEFDTADRSPRALMAAEIKMLTVLEANFH